MKDFWLDLKAWLGVLDEFGGVLYADHVRFDPCHPYYRASVDALNSQQLFAHAHTNTTAPSRVQRAAVPLYK